MKIRKPRFDTMTLIAVGAAVLGIVAYWTILTLASEYYVVQAPAGSTFDAGEDGTKVLLNYLRELDIEVDQVRQFDSLPEDGTLVVIAEEPLIKSPTREEMRLLERWVRDGGRLVIIGPFAPEVLEDGLPRGATPEFEAAAREGGGLAAALGRATAVPDTVLEPLQPSAYTRGVGRIAVDGRRALVADPAWVTLFKDRHGQALVVRVFGKGEMVWLASARPATNAAIARRDNARLVTLLVASAGPVHFDEYHHGFVRGGGVWDRLGAGGRAASLLGMLALAVLLAAVARRVAPALDEEPARPARGGAYIGSLAELYRKAGARSEALATLEEPLASALARRWGSADAALARSAPGSEALARSREARGAAGIREEAFVSIARDLMRARQEVDGGHG